MQSYFYIPSFFRPNTLIKCILHTYRGQNTGKTLKCRFFKKWLDVVYEMLPADHFVCEKNSLHLWVSDMVAALILNDLEKMRQNA